jgi:hypothetical protein
MSMEKCVNGKVTTQVTLAVTHRKLLQLQEKMEIRVGPSPLYLSLAERDFRVSDALARKIRTWPGMRV